MTLDDDPHPNAYSRATNAVYAERQRRALLRWQVITLVVLAVTIAVWIGAVW